MKQIELQAKLLNYFLGSNKSNINQSGLGTEQTLRPVVRVLVSFEHEAALFYMRHQNPYTVFFLPAPT